MKRAARWRPLVLLTRGPLPAADAPYERELGRRLLAAGLEIRFLAPDGHDLRGTVDSLADTNTLIGICATGAAADEALDAAECHSAIRALILRGGSKNGTARPVACPTLLLASESVPGEVEWARELGRLIGSACLAERIRSPLDRFSDRRGLEYAAATACRWFTHHLVRSPPVPDLQHQAHF